MNAFEFSFANTTCCALAEGALWCPASRAMIVSDLHLGKSIRMARRGGGLLPPYENTETLIRLDSLVDRLDPLVVVCLGDSFDDSGAAHEMPDTITEWITRLQAGRQWIWITGNHDPAPLPMGGTQLAQWLSGNIVFRHIASTDASAEVSGHYHPKKTVRTRGRTITRPCFLIDRHRVIMPAFGTFTGGLRTSDPAFSGLMENDALAVLTGKVALPVPMADPRNN